MHTGKYELTFTSQADQEIFKAVRWYEERREGLGLEFEQELEAAWKKIQTSPFLYQAVFEGMRRYNLNKFPYAVFYKVKFDEVRVLGVLGFKQDDRLWKER